MIGRQVLLDLVSSHGYLLEERPDIGVLVSILTVSGLQIFRLSPQIPGTRVKTCVSLSQTRCMHK